MQAKESRFDGVSHDPTITEQETMAELDRVLSDRKFRTTERNRRFLRYVTEKLLEGEEEKVKAYSIAVDVFGRPENFDPAIDPIVRIEATRLRASLAQYYELHGQDGGLRIDLPKGGYIPAIKRLDPAGDRPRSATSWRDQSSEVPVSRLKPSSMSVWAVISIGVVGGLLLIGFFLLHAFGQRRNIIISEEPSVTIDVSSAGFDADAEKMRDALMVALSQFRTLKLLKPPTGNGEPQLRASSPAALHRNSYRVELKYHQDELAQSVWWQIIDLQSGEVLISRNEMVPGSKSPAVTRTLAGQLAIQIAGFEGVINSVETRREIANPTLGNGCVLRSYHSLQSGDPPALMAARTCLERTLAHRPGDADAYAVLSAVLLAIDPPGAPTELSSRALELANRSATLTPFSALSALAQTEALFRSGHIDEAILAGRRAVLLNPNDSKALAKIGSMFCVVGRREEGIPLVMKAGEMGGRTPRYADIAPAMDACRRGASDEAPARSRQQNNAPCCGIGILRTAAFEQLEKKQEAQAAAETLRDLPVGIGGFFQSHLTVHQFDTRSFSLPKTGLSKAGLRTHWVDGCCRYQQVEVLG